MATVRPAAMPVLPPDSNAETPTLTMRTYNLGVFFRQVAEIPRFGGPDSRRSAGVGSGMASCVRRGIVLALILRPMRFQRIRNSRICGHPAHAATGEVLTELHFAAIFGFNVYPARH